MPLIPEPVLDDIQARVDIADVIGHYVPLKRAGRHFKGLCPFHKERTPSFHVNTDKQIFHCFGCGAGGNVFTFLMQQERLTFPEAARSLAEQVGVPMPDAASSGSGAQTPPLLELMDKACRYYERMLADPARGRAAREYLRSRGVTEQTRRLFRLGYAPGAGAQLLKAAQQAKVPPERLEQAGLSLRSARGVVDRFRERLLFPIFDARGRIVAFGGRSLQGQEPKYLNSPETALYTKGRHLYGLAQAKDAIATRKLAIIVEGYFDCVLLWQAGFTHAVSPLGTALTPEQAKLLARQTDRVILAFDPDVAGEQATRRGIDVLVEAGFQVSVAQLPSGIDPDEFIATYGTTAFERVLKQALGIVEFLILCAGDRRKSQLKDQPGADPEQKIRLAQQVLQTLARVPDAMRRREYARLLADRLQLDEAAVAQEVEKAAATRTSADGRRRFSGARVTVLPPAPASGPRADAHKVQRVCAALVLDDPSRFERLVADGLLDQITDSELRRVLAAMNELRATSPTGVTLAQLISRISDDAGVRLVAELAQLAHEEPSKDEAFDKCLQRLRQQAYDRHHQQLQEQLRTAETLGQHDESRRILIKLDALKRESRPESVGKMKVAHG